MRNAARRISHLGASGQKSRFCAASRPARLSAAPTAARLVPESRADAKNVSNATGVDEVNSVSYLPAAFTTLFFLAASLLLGLIR